MIKTACTCHGPEPGQRTFWCQRHQCRKTAHWHQLCQTRPDYFQAWEQGRGPGQQPKRSRPAQARKQTAAARETVDKEKLRQEASRHGLAQLAGRYTRALYRWAKAGYPTRSEQDVAWIFDHYCRPCKWHENGTCTVCGCRVARTGMAVRNKIKMASESCPRGKWPAAGRRQAATENTPVSGSSEPVSMANLSRSFLKDLIAGGLGESSQEYLDAIRRWTLAGMPVRNAAQIRRLYNQHCRHCTQRQQNTCQASNLPVYRRAAVWKNALALATEPCPLNRWQISPLTIRADRPPLIEIAVGVVTAPRPGPPLIGRCWESLRRTGFEANDILVFAEPGTKDPRLKDPQVEVVWRMHRYGEFRNWIYGLRSLLDRRPRANALMMVQDDTLWMRNVRDWLELSLWPSPQCGAVQVYTSRGYRRQPKGISRVQGRKHRWLLAACAIVVPRVIAEKIVKYGLTAGWRGHVNEQIHDPALKEAADAFIGQALRSVCRELWVHNPTLVEHDDGGHSALKHGPAESGNRASLDFPGLDSDPFNLFALPEKRFTIE